MVVEFDQLVHILQHGHERCHPVLSSATFSDHWHPELFKARLQGFSREIFSVIVSWHKISSCLAYLR